MYDDDDNDDTRHIAGCNNSIRHIENRSSPFFVFLMQFRLWRAAAFVSSPIHLFYCTIVLLSRKRGLLYVTEEPIWDLSVEMILENRNRTALVKWMCDDEQRPQQRPHKWMLTIINLTWTVDDLQYHQWIYVIDPRMYSATNFVTK